MLRTIKKSVVLCAVTFAVSGFAHADINTSLQTVCTNAKEQAKQTVNKKMEKVHVTYRAKLANYYAGVSCNGKSLIHTSMQPTSQSAGSLATRKILK